MGLLEAGPLWMKPGPLRDVVQTPPLLHRVPLDSEGHQGSQEPPGKWYVCIWG